MTCLHYNNHWGLMWNEYWLPFVCGHYSAAKKLPLNFDYIALIKSNERGSCSSGFLLNDTRQQSAKASVPQTNDDTSPEQGNVTAPLQVTAVMLAFLANILTKHFQFNINSKLVCLWDLPSIRLTSSSNIFTFFWIPGCANV